MPLAGGVLNLMPDAQLGAQLMEGILARGLSFDSWQTADQ